jgi:hypothetical protein
MCAAAGRIALDPRPGVCTVTALMALHSPPALVLRMRGDRRASCLIVDVKLEGACNVSAFSHYTQGALSRPDSARAN